MLGKERGGYGHNLWQSELALRFNLAFGLANWLHDFRESQLRNSESSQIPTRTRTQAQPVLVLDWALGESSTSTNRRNSLAGRSLYVGPQF
jgi:hypothetical protein